MDPFAEENVQHNIEKAVPQAMAELNRQILEGDDERVVGLV